MLQFTSFLPASLPGNAGEMSVQPAVEYVAKDWQVRNSFDPSGALRHLPYVVGEAFWLTY